MGTCAQRLFGWSGNGISVATMSPVLRCTALARWCVALVVLLGGGVHWAHGLHAQDKNRAAPLETIQIRPNVYVIFGAGANVTVQVGADGLVLVDSGSTEM